jgi:ketosteroid isomerase-like protein
MGQDSLDRCRKAYELYGAADFDAMLELFAEDVVVYVAPPNFESGTYEGRATYRALIERWGAPWSEMRIEPLSMEPAGEWILAKVEYHGRARSGDLEIRQLSWELSLWRDGQVQRYEVYWDAAEGAKMFAERKAEAAAAQ